MLHETFVRSWVPGVILWFASFLLYHGLRVANTRLYEAGARQSFEWASSSGQHESEVATDTYWYRVYAVLTLLGIGALLAVTWIYSRELAFWKSLYLAVLGSCTLPQITASLRLLNNLIIFRAVRDGQSIVGKIRFSEVFVHRSSAAMLVAYAGLYVLLAAVAADWYCLGGALGCLLAAHRENERAVSLKAKPRGESLEA